MSDFKPHINVEELLKLAFGIPESQFKYKVGFDAQKIGTVNFGNIPTAEPIQANKMSWMGTPIMFPIMFKGGEYNIFDNTGGIHQKAMNDFWLPPTTLTDFRRSTIITKTPVVGHSGTIKEHKTFDDWHVRFRGLCLDTPIEKAYDQMNKINEWFNLVDSIEVVGSLFLQKNIYRVLLEDISIQSNLGNSSAIPFVIEASSDSPIEHEK